MTSTFTESLFSKQQKEQDKQQKLIDKRTEQVRKGLSKFDKTFDNAVKALDSIVNSIADDSVKKEVTDLLKQTKQLDDVRSRLKKKGQTINKSEVDTLLKTANTVDNLIKTNPEISDAIKQSGTKLGSVDTGKTISNISNKLGSSFEDFFKNNINTISSQGIGDDAAQTGVSAISPELGFVTQSLGINLTDSFSNIFSETEEDNDLINQGINELSNEIEVLSDSTNSIATAIDNQTTVVMSQDEIRRELEEDRHTEMLEHLDDINDSVEDNNKNGFSRFLGKNSFIGKVLGKLATPFVGLSSLLGGGKLGKTGKGIGLAAGGFLAGDAIIDAFISGDSSVGGVLKGASGGALAGAMFGPIGALIGGAVGGLTTLVAGSLTEEQKSKLINTFNNIGGFFKEKFGKFVSEVSSSIEFISNILSDFLEDPMGAIDKGFEKLGNVISDTLGIVFSGFENLAGFVTDIVDMVKGAGKTFADSLGLNEPDTVKVMNSSGEIVEVKNQFKPGIGGFLSDLTGIGSNPIKDAVAAAKAPTILNTGINTNSKTLQQMQTESTEASNNNIIRQLQEQNNKMTEKQTKVTKEIIKEVSSRDKAQRSSGRINHDNSPVMSTDLGFIMVNGGGTI